MIVKLPFGSDTLAVDLRGVRVRPLTPAAPAGSRRPAELILDAVERPTSGPPLSRLCAGRSHVVILVPDATRRIGLPEILPGLLAHIQRHCEQPGRMTVLLACGTHPAIGERALAELVGRLPEGTGCVQHDARADIDLRVVGTLGGRTIRLNRLAVEADLLLSISAVKHHYFAGFGGGPKMVFPGVAGYDEIQSNHALVMSAGERNPKCEPGILAGNPVAEEIAAAADLRPVDCAVCLVPGSDGAAARAVAGPWREAFAEVVQKVRDWYEVKVPGRFRLCVASAHGAPSDHTLIQAHKAIDAACRFMADGGELLFAADLSGGPGSDDMVPFLETPHPEAIRRRLESGWVQYGHTTLRLVERTSRFRIHLVSRLDQDLARRLGFEPVSDPAEVIESWRRRFEGETTALMPGAAVYPSEPPPST